jgi:hypothetical protein
MVLYGREYLSSDICHITIRGIGLPSGSQVVLRCILACGKGIELPSEYNTDVSAELSGV